MPGRRWRMSKAFAQRPSRRLLIVSGFELPVTSEIWWPFSLSYETGGQNMNQPEEDTRDKSAFIIAYSACAFSGFIMGILFTVIMQVLF